MNFPVNLPSGRIAEHALNFPEHPAVVLGKRTVTYEALHSTAGAIGLLLKHQFGIGKNKVVAILMERSIEQVFVALGVNYAGGCCLFLSTSHPKDYIAEILLRAGPSLLIAGDGVDPCHYLSSGVARIDWREISTSYQPWVGKMPQHDADSDSAATLFQTSGSDGLPKLVPMSFGQYDPNDCRPPQTERHISRFDAGTTFLRHEIFFPLVTGQTLHVLPSGADRQAAKILTFIEELSVTDLLITASGLKSLIAASDARGIPCLERVLCIGEPVSESLVKRFFERSSGRLIISYGCTEAPSMTTVVLHGYRPGEPVSVGKPQKFREVYVLSDDLRELSPGQEGEICCGGYISKGYVGNPELTRKLFIPNPVEKSDFPVLFRTGDRGRWLDSGDLQVLGRNDEIIKIAGHRVHPGQVAAKICEIPYVSDLFVKAIDFPNGRMALVAYFTSNADTKIDEEYVRSSTKELLPRHMIPLYFVHLKEFPTLGNGKIDRNRLPPPDRISSDLNIPTDDMSSCHDELSRIWQRILGCSTVAKSDNFSELGGDSQAAMEFEIEIEKTFDVQFPQDFKWDIDGNFETLTKIVQRLRGEKSHRQPRRMRVGGDIPLFFIAPLGGNLQHYTSIIKGLDPRFCVYGIAPRLPDKVSLQSRNIKALGRLAAQSISEVGQQTSPLIIGYSNGGLIANAIAGLMQSKGKSCQLLLIDTYLSGPVTLTTFLRTMRLSIRRRKYMLNPLRRYLITALLGKFGISHLLPARYLDAWSQLSYAPDRHEQHSTYILASSSKDLEHLRRWAPHFNNLSEVIELPATHADVVLGESAQKVASYINKTIRKTSALVTQEIH